ncbi:TatD family hydrolase [Alphaproteobacteria bacterium]|nr:TatD family hydrolase [Alphaproteobacteria bacterium]
MWIDSHCHLTHEKFGDVTPDTLVSNAVAAGVDGMLCINCRIVDEFPTILKTAQSFDNVWCTIGTHPHEAGKAEELTVSQDELVAKALSDLKIVGIGETGLDYHYDFAPREDQIESFRKHIRACLETDLPMVVHAREADEDIIRIIKEESPDGKLRGVMHCFSSGRKMAEEALEIGFYISFSGIVTFKKATELQDIARDVPLDRILVETDAPYLAPEPYRGKQNEPAYVSYTGRKIAELHGVSEEEVAKTTSGNFFKLFNHAIS